MKQENCHKAKKKRNQSILPFGVIFLCAMLAVAVFSACNAVKKYGGGKEQVEAELANSQEEAAEEAVNSRAEAAEEPANDQEEAAEEPANSRKETAGSSADSQEKMAAKGNKNSYERYLEISDPSKITKEHMIETVCYSRKMSGEERVRYRDLQDRYEDGELAPKEEIDIVDKMEATDREVEYPVFEIWNQEYFLPERKLTDEDLLRMIDFEYKWSAALLQRSEELSKSAKASPHKVDEDEAMEIAGLAVEKMFGLASSSMDKEVQYNGAGSYYVFLSEKPERTAYTVMIAMGTGRIEWIGTNVREDEGENAVEINQEFEQLCSANYKKAKTLLENILGSDIEIVSGWFQYMADVNGKEIPREGQIIHYFFQIEDDMCHMKYSIVKGNFEHLSVDEKKDFFYRTKEELEKESTKKDGDKYFVPLTGMDKEIWGDNLQWIVVPME